MPQIHAGLVWQDIRELDLSRLGRCRIISVLQRIGQGIRIIRIGFPTDDFHESRITDLNSAYIVHKKEAVEIGFVNARKNLPLLADNLVQPVKFLRSRLFRARGVAGPDEGRQQGYANGSESAQAVDLGFLLRNDFIHFRGWSFENEQPFEDGWTTCQGIDFLLASQRKPAAKGHIFKAPGRICSRFKHDAVAAQKSHFGFVAILVDNPREHGLLLFPVSGQKIRKRLFKGHSQQKHGYCFRFPCAEHFEKRVGHIHHQARGCLANWTEARPRAFCGALHKIFLFLGQGYGKCLIYHGLGVRQQNPGITPCAAPGKIL